MAFIDWKHKITKATSLQAILEILREVANDASLSRLERGILSAHAHARWTMRYSI